MGEKSSMLHKMFETGDQHATGHQHVDNMHDVLSHVLVGKATNFLVQDAPIDEDHGQIAYSMGQAYARANVAVKNPSRAQWTLEEDEMLQEHVKEHGKTAWLKIAKKLPRRSGKQCRERFINHVDPEIKTTPWTKAEEQQLVKYHKLLGKRWAQMATRIPGRSENNIKNKWHAAVRGVRAQRKNKMKEPRSTIVEDYIRSLDEEGKKKKEKATYSGRRVPTAGPVHPARRSGQKINKVVTASTQAPAASQHDNNPLPPPPPFPGLNAGEHLALDAIGAVHQPFAYYPQESGYYIPSPYELAPGNPFAEDHHQVGGYYNDNYNQLQLHQYPFSAQQEEQAFSSYRAAEDPNQVFAGRYLHEAAHNQVLPGLYYSEAGPSNYGYGNGGGSSGSASTTGLSEIVTNQLAMLAIENEEAGPSHQNPTPPGGWF